MRFCISRYHVTLHLYFARKAAISKTQNALDQKEHLTIVRPIYELLTLYLRRRKEVMFSLMLSAREITYKVTNGF